MRAYLEQKSFDEIYPEYSKNPIHVIRRSLRRLISLIRQDGAVIREGRFGRSEAYRAYSCRGCRQGSGSAR
ncbi:MAG: hypothetical protein L6V87_00295 [Ruminococcus sp.]|nr:MAG: hypothetical protein L6V87_00295 [Ruminococcus sp.]